MFILVKVEVKVGRKKRLKIEFRYYQMPAKQHVFALLGNNWIREYGQGVEHLHFHNYLEIGHCIWGEGQMLFGNDLTYDYNGGEFTVIPKNYLHTTNSIPGTRSHWEYLFVDVNAFANKIYHDNNKEICKEFIRYIERDPLFFKKEDNPLLANAICELIEVHRNTDSFYLEESEGLLEVILSRIARIGKQADKNKLDNNYNPLYEKTSGVVIKAMEYVRKHYHEHIRIDEIAQYCYISETHFRRVFSEYMKMGILEYINFIRIQEACAYLRTLDKEIKEIAYLCGFPTISTFNRNFKKIMGTNPLSWKKSPENYERHLFNSDICIKKGW